MDILGLERRDHTSSFANDEIAKDLNIAFDGAVDTDVAIGFERADNASVGADHGLGATVHCAGCGRLCFLIVAEHWSSSAVPAGVLCKMWSAGRPSDPQSE